MAGANQTHQELINIVTSLMGIGAFSFAILAIAATPADKFWIMLVSMFMIGFMMPMANGLIHLQDG